MVNNEQIIIAEYQPTKVSNFFDTFVRRNVLLPYIKDSQRLRANQKAIKLIVFKEANE
jgi:hypothetical protein